MNAPPEVVWRTLVDAAQASPTTGLAALGSAGPDWPAAGAERPAAIRLGPLRVRVAVTSTEARPARRFRIGLEGSVVAGEARWELASVAGGTRVACRIVVEGRSRLGRLLVRVDRRALPARLEAELAQLKAAAEAATGPGARSR